MAPTKSTRTVVLKQTTNVHVPGHQGNFLPITRKGHARQSTQVTTVQDQNMDIMQTRGKRKAEQHSPLKNEMIKRSALGNLTNNVNMANMGLTTTSTLHPEEDAKQQINKKKENINTNTHSQMGSTHVLLDIQNITNMVSGPVTRQNQNKMTTRATARNAQTIQVLDDQTNRTDESTKKTKKSETDVPPQILSLLKGPQVQVPLAVQVAVAASFGFNKLPNKPTRRISNEFNKTEESLYMSALEDVSSSESLRLSGNFEAAKRRSEVLQNEKKKTELGKLSGIDTDLAALAGSITIDPVAKRSPVPEGVDDFDKENWNDIFQVSHYAMDIFEYLKTREEEFPIEDYMTKQVNLSKWMRSLLVDWMVEVQETFELNHETLYLAVKIVDIYLSRVIINKDKLQLLGAAALFISCKFDERTPPLVEDFLYICDGAYKHDELIRMEIETLRTIGFDLGIPLSYRFLRRYARCGKIHMKILTLARYILELSLMDYDTIRWSDSKLACAALFIALRMQDNKPAWTKTLQYYSGYQLEDFAVIVPMLNAGLHRKPKCTIKTIRNKYSHKIFHEVAKIKPLTNEELLAEIIQPNDNHILDLDGHIP